MNRFRILSKSISALIVSVTVAHLAHSAVYVWDGGAGTGELTTNTNWNPDGVPSPAIPDTMQWNGNAGGPLALTYSTAAFAGAAGNTGLNLDVAGGQFDALNIDAASTSSFRMNGLTVAAGAGAFSLGNGVGPVFNLTLGGGPATHTWTNNSSNAVTLGSEIVVGLGGGGAHTLSLNGAGGFVFNNPVSQGTGVLTMNVTNNATATFNATSTYTGTTNVGVGAATGIVRVNANNALGSGPIAFGNNATEARLELLGGRTLANPIIFAGRNTASTAIQSVSGANTLSGTVTLTTGGSTYRIQADAGSTLVLANATAITGAAIGGTRTVTLGGAGAGFVNGAIVNGTGTTVVAIAKTDAGIWTLNGANTYTGSTAVNGGTLITTPAQTGATSVTVADGATFGVKLAAPGTTFQVGTLTTGTAAGSTLLFDTGTFGNPTAPVINASTFTPNAATVFNVTGSGLTVANNIPLLDYSGGIGGVDFGGLSLVLPARTVGSLVNNTADSRVDLDITQFEQIKWQGNVNGRWDADTDGTGANGTQNWVTTTSLTPTKYLQGTGGTDTVNFTNSATGTTAIDIAVPVAPIATNFDNSTKNYTFSSTGGFGIGGGGALTKSGTGSVTLGTANSYSGGTILNAGTINVNNASALGTGAVTIAAGAFDNTSGAPLAITTNNAQNWNGDFTFNGTNDLDFGSGAVTIGGLGTDRVVSITGGTLTVGEIKSATLGLDKQGAGTLVVDSVGTGTTGSVVAGALNVGAGGTLQINRTGALAAASGDFTAGGLMGAGTVTNGAAVERWLFVNPSGDLNFTGTLTNGTGAALGFNKQGSGTQTLSGANGYTGQTTVGGGTLRIAAPLANSPVAVTGGTLSLEVAGAVSQNVITFSGTGALAETVDNAISGNASVVAQKSITLSRPNAYSGDTTINAGTGTTVTITDAAAAGSGRLNAASGATNATFALHIDGGGTIAMPNSFGGNSGVTSTIDVDNNGIGSGGLIQLGGTGLYGNGTLTVTGSNGYNLAIAGFTNNAGSAGNATLNPTTANITLGNYSSSTNFAKTLVLDGTSSGNAVTGSLTDGTNVVSVTKSNTSTWTLSGAGTYTGATNVNGGELIVTGSISGTSAVNVAAGATLSSNSSVTTGGSVTLGTGGFLEPGNGAAGNVGTLTLSASGLLDIAAASDNSGSLKFDLTGPGASDLITLSTGMLNIGSDVLGFSDFAFNSLAGFGQGTYTLIDSGTSIIGTLDPTNLTGGVGTLTGTLAFSADGNDIVLTVVPEPGSAALLLAAAACLGLRRRRSV